MAEQRWRTAIGYPTDRGVVVRGYRIEDLMEHLDFAGMLFVLFQGRRPTAEEAKLVNAILISVADHSIVATSAVTRITAASGVPIQACVAAGITTIGDVHGGAGQEFARQLGEWVEEAGREGVSIDQKARAIVEARAAAKQRIDGYGHPLHREGDVRVEVLCSLADRLKLAGSHLQLARALEREIERRAGKRIPMNIDGAISAVVMDLGFDWRLTRAFIFVPRAAGLAAHANEEATRERGWRKVASSEEILYDGAPLRAWAEPERR